MQVYVLFADYGGAPTILGVFADTQIAQEALDQYRYGPEGPFYTWFAIQGHTLDERTWEDLAWVKRLKEKQNED